MRNPPIRKGLQRPPKVSLTDRMMLWQTIACRYLTQDEKVHIAELVAWTEQGMPAGFKFTKPVVPRIGAG